ncbi:MAG: hypothetical protein IPG04_40655 [Polyangiaceae bacterium]|nr:hypothetical protein [Polyangiaceae bacterium]
MQFKLADADGLPLDIDGLLTEGLVETRFVLSHLVPQAGTPGYYEPYTTIVQNSPTTGMSAAAGRPMPAACTR